MRFWTSNNEKKGRSEIPRGVVADSAAAPGPWIIRLCALGLTIANMAILGVFAAPVRAQGTAGPAQQGALTINLTNALERAHENSQQLQSAAIGVDLAHEDRVQARAALLPALNYVNQFIYTQGNGTPSGVFVGNDGVHVYNSQAAVHVDLFSPERRADYQRTIAAQALAAARRDVVERGLVATVVQFYYGLSGAQRKLANTQEALKEAQRFVTITSMLEAGGEVARADVLKAQLVLQQRQRESENAQLEVENARIGLAVLLFPDYLTDFNIVDDLAAVSPLQAYGEIEALAEAKSPELRVAAEGIRQEEFNIKIAHAAHLPTLSFEYFYGINANQFAVRDREGNRLLGSAAQVTLDIPLWNWGATGSKVRAAEMRRRQAQLDLELTRRQLISDLRLLYAEARAAWVQVESLQRTVTDATESLRLTNLRYEAGEISAIEVVDAQSTLVQARNDYDDGLSRYRKATAGIETLTGRI
jgi:outer membrane protein TolC